jgi:signal transduction histidine kinase
MRFFHSQLYWRIYLAVLASLALSGLLAAVAWHLFFREPPVFTQLGTLARTAAIAIDSAATQTQNQQSLQRLHDRFNIGLALYDSNGTLIASAVTLPVPPKWSSTTEGYIHTRHEAVTYVTAVDGGGWLLAQADTPHTHPHPGFLPLLALIAIAVAICAQPIVRRLTIRLERLKATVDRFGDGDLSTRVVVEGRDEIAAIANSFNLSVARVEQLVNSQRALLANASHELRSPLARLRMSVELAGLESATAQQAEIQKNIAELDQLIDEILLASRLDLNDAGALNKQPVDFTALLAEECARTRAELNAEPIQLQGDARLLRRLIRNLLENSVRYGASTPVEVSLRKGDANNFRLEVADRGPGIPEQEREKIFAPFYRLPNASESGGGVGLGLSLVKQVAAKHGGTVQCLPREGGGSLFVVTLPIG